MDGKVAQLMSVVGSTDADFCKMMLESNGGDVGACVDMLVGRDTPAPAFSAPPAAQFTRPQTADTADFQSALAASMGGTHQVPMESEDAQLARALAESQQMSMGAAPPAQARPAPAHTISNTSARDPPPRRQPAAPATLEFQVLYQERTYSLQVSLQGTIKDLKESVSALTGVPVAEQNLLNWPVESLDKQDTDPLRQHIGNENPVMLWLVKLGGPPQAAAAPSRQLKFRVDFSGAGQHDISLPESATLKDLKDAVAAKTGLATYSQELDNWPRASPNRDEHRLANYINKTGVTELFLYQNAEVGPADSSAMDISMSGGFSHGASNDDDDDGFDVRHMAPSSTSTGLVPAGTTDPAQFGISFVERYGASAAGPLFATDSLARTLQRALDIGQPVVVYLHSDSSVETNVFATQVLQSPVLLPFLLQSVTLWGWDMSRVEGRNRFQTMVQSLNGRLWGEMPRQYPALVTLCLSGASTHFVDSLSGFHDHLTVLALLQDQLTDCAIRIGDHQKTKHEANERHRIREEQDAAFEASKLVDFHKAQEETRQKAAAQKAAADAEQARRDEEAAATRLVTQVEDDKAAAGARVPAEASKEDPTAVTVQFRNRRERATFSRVFLKSHTVQNVADFVHSNGFPNATHDMVIPRPRQILSQDKWGQTLEGLGFGKRELIEVEKRDL